MIHASEWIYFLWLIEVKQGLEEEQVNRGLRQLRLLYIAQRKSPWWSAVIDDLMSQETLLHKTSKGINKEHKLIKITLKT